MRFTLLSLIGFVAIAALGCAALVNANYVWLVVVASFTSTVLTMAVIVAFLGNHGSTRAFCIGFAIAYVLNLSPLFFATESHPARLLQYLWSTMQPKLPYDSGAPVIVYAPTVDTPQSPPTVAPIPRSAAPSTSDGWSSYPAPMTGSPDYDRFMQIGQQLWALLIGCLGGVFAFWLWRRASRHTP